MKELKGLPPSHKGKVRNIYNVMVGMDPGLLLVTTDRLSAFDVVLPDTIPDKGKVLNQISLFWFEKMKSIIGNHIVSAEPADYPEVFAPYKDVLDKRSVMVKKCTPFVVECIVRGYITGSGWKDYLETGSVCGIALPEGMQESEKFPEPLFTPSTKAPQGDHDINVSLDEAGNEISDKMGLDGAVVIRQLKQFSLDIYNLGAAYALEKGIIIADTKFEFGLYEGKIVLIDEILTPDSSRFWPADEYEPGRGQRSFDKQPVRDYLQALVNKGEWDKKAPGPELPVNIIYQTSSIYKEIYTRLTDQEL